MKKVLSLVLVLVLALGMSTVAFAATTKADHMAPGAGASIEAAAVLGFKGVTAGDLIFGTNWEIPLLASYFEDEDDSSASFANASAGGTLTSSEVTKGKVKAVAKVISGKAAFDELVIEKESAGMVLKVNMKDPILVTSSDDIELDLEIAFYVDGTKQKDEIVSLAGTYQVEVLAPDAEDEGDSTVDGQLVKPEAYNPSWIATLDADDTIQATMKLFKNRNFYIRAKQEVKDADAETVDAYGFDQIYYVAYSANAVSSVQKINFLDLEDDFYVYGSKSGQAIKSKADIAKNLVLLGTTSDDLPLYSMYYLASKQVDLEVVEDAAAEVLEPVAGDAPELAPVTGGDGYVANVNDNPGTGK